MAYRRTFFNHEHIDRYLRGCIIRHNDTPIYVRMIDRVAEGNYVFHYLTVGKREDLKQVLYADQGIDYSPVPLGFVNWQTWGNPSVARASRLPTRAWKIGLTSNNLYLEQLTSKSRPNDSGAVFNSTPLANTIKNIYPSFEDSVKAVSGKEDYQVAFSRRFAMDYRNRLYSLYVRGDVGSINPDNGDIQLDNEYKYMSEMLAEDLGK